MKITKSQLKQIIQEELSKLQNEKQQPSPPAQIPAALDPDKVLQMIPRLCKLFGGSQQVEKIAMQVIDNPKSLGKILNTYRKNLEPLVKSMNIPGLGSLDAFAKQFEPMVQQYFEQFFKQVEGMMIIPVSRQVIEQTAKPLIKAAVSVAITSACGS
tara:strand:- start:92 stop:559 length:468 start_codon:yes stop_codon:yes gene_type:complete